MGEIGIDRHQFFFILPFWEISAIVAGYRKRERTYCNMTRWATFMMMSAGMADLGKAGIHSPEDLLKFPWDNEHQAPPLSADEVDDIRRELRKINDKKSAE